MSGTASTHPHGLHSGGDDDNTSAWFIAGSSRSSGAALALSPRQQQQTLERPEAAAVRIFVNGYSLRDTAR